MGITLLTKLSLSIVSHHQAPLVRALLDDIQRDCADLSMEVILTLNVAESLPFEIKQYTFPIHLTCNATPKGFGSNHNAAFRLATGDYFCILNPDIRLLGNPFPTLVDCLQHSAIGLVAPRVVSREGVREDSARRFPALSEIARKLFGGKSAIYVENHPSIFYPDWVAGMFMLLPHNVYQSIGGFDESYFLYYEDVDLCARLTLANHRIALCSNVSVIHDARRSSHKNLRYMRLHFTSIVRFFTSSVYRKLRRSVSR
jgi:GT2 family glycosyltransferase